MLRCAQGDNGAIPAYRALARQKGTPGAQPTRILAMPTWVMSLSIFHLYGNPVFQGMNWDNFLGMTGVAMAQRVTGLVQFHYEDVEPG
jgi:hypothetical protein